MITGVRRPCIVFELKEQLTWLQMWVTIDLGSPQVEQCTVPQKKNKSTEIHDKIKIQSTEMYITVIGRIAVQTNDP